MKKIVFLLLFTSVIFFMTGFVGIAQITYPHHFTYNGNPLVRTHGAADPDAHVWDDTVWVYCSQDHETINGDTYKTMDGYHVFSSADLVNWTDHGEVLHSRDVDWGQEEGGHMWAPCAARKKDASGKYVYYLYFPHKDKEHKWKIGVAISDKASGPFTDIGNYIEGTTGIDPSVLVDDDGQAYMYYDHNKMARLKDNMIEFAEEPQKLVYGSKEVMENSQLSAHEGPFIHKYKGKYYFSYTNLNNSEFHAYYSIADNPYGPFDFQGPMSGGSRGAQDHHSVIDFKGQPYYFYHIALDRSYNIPPNKKGQGRVASFDKLYYNPDGTINLVKHTFGPHKSLSVDVPNGYFTFDPPGGDYEEGTEVKVTAYSNLGYQFDSWSGDANGSENPLTLVIDEDKKITANFKSTPVYTLRSSAENGAVKLKSTLGKYDGKITASEGEFNEGTLVELEAIDKFGYDFDSWSGDLKGSENPAAIVMDKDKTIEAVFKAVPVYNLSAEAINGSVKLLPPGGKYEAGTKVKVEAIRDYGYGLTKWTGDLKGTENPTTVVMNNNINATAVFDYTGGGKIVFAANCGGVALKSSEGVRFTDDRNNLGGGTFTSRKEIVGTENDTLFHNYRFGDKFGYEIPLENGHYEISLYFAETFFGSAGKRVFDVHIEGEEVLPKFDIWEDVGKNASCEKQFEAKVSDGSLNITINSIVNNGLISAIKVLKPDE